MRHRTRPRGRVSPPSGPRWGGDTPWHVSRQRRLRHDGMKNAKLTSTSISLAGRAMEVPVRPEPLDLWVRDSRGGLPCGICLFGFTLAVLGPEPATPASGTADGDPRSSDVSVLPSPPPSQPLPSRRPRRPSTRLLSHDRVAVSVSASAASSLCCRRAEHRPEPENKKKRRREKKKKGRRDAAEKRAARRY